MSPATRNAVSVMIHTLGWRPSRHGSLNGHAGVQRCEARVGVPLNASVSWLRSGDPLGHRVVLVHGTPGKAEGWSDYLLNPPPGIELVALDRPGFAHSASTGARPDLAGQAAAVEACLPVDGRKTTLLGHSLGGAVVARMAALFPERVERLILLAAALDPTLERIHPLQPWAARQPLRALLPAALRHSNEELLRFRNQLEALAPLLERIQAPTHIIHGTRDHLVPFANVAYMQRMLRPVGGLRVEVLKGGDHFLPWNAHAVVRSALTGRAGRGQEQVAS